MSWEGLKDIVVRIGGSSLADKLVLRGSFVMRIWFGDAARDPGDVDFMVADRWLELAGEDGDAIMTELVEVLGTPKWSEFLMGYPDVSGWTMAFPDAAMDLAFEERLRREPEVIEVDGVPVKVASRAEALAWKLRWLVEFPIPKDLYDAVLLAESIRAAGGEVDMAFARELISDELGDDVVLSSKWAEHIPRAEMWEAKGLPGRPEEWMDRLSAACGPLGVAR